MERIVLNQFQLYVTWCYTPCYNANNTSSTISAIIYSIGTSQIFTKALSALGPCVYHVNGVKEGVRNDHVKGPKEFQD